MWVQVRLILLPLKCRFCIDLLPIWREHHPMIDIVLCIWIHVLLQRLLSRLLLVLGVRFTTFGFEEGPRPDVVPQVVTDIQTRHRTALALDLRLLVKDLLL